MYLFTLCAVLGAAIAIILIALGITLVERWEVKEAVSRPGLSDDAIEALRSPDHPVYRKRT